MPTDALDDLVKLLDIEPIEVNIFRGISPEEDRQRIFGGQVAGQALVAAARTLEAEQPRGRGPSGPPPEAARAGSTAERRVHSLHAYFLRAGDPQAPILYEVDRIRDGRSFTTRRVVAIQHGRAIFNLSASFQADEPGFEHAFDMPEVTAPEELPDLRQRAAAHGDKIPWVDRPRPIDIRHVDWLPPDRKHPLPPRQRVWMRADGRLPDDPLIHTIVLTYASDMTLLDTSMLPHGGSWFDTGLFMASLDHAMWFHRPFRADDWLLYDQDSPSASNGRGLSRGLVYTRSGTLVATVMQEGLIRVAR
ncbi:MAG TPA: acyl-CoA thioesterase II [Acidimicrobiales bacterium]|nr:acyl-CoA thioesterase II [Acidimicrobiales bacterium]